MAEYIEREAALKKLQMQLLDLEADQDKGEYSELCENRGARDALDVAIYDIRALKPADVQPAKHGKWESSQRTIETGTVYCSNCAIEYYISDLQTVGDYNGIVHYCPNCGARMDGDTNA